MPAPNPLTKALLFAVLHGVACACIAAGISIPTKSDPTVGSIPAQVFKPEGAGPFPAVVILHDCSGLSATSSGAPRRWSNLLVEKGYVTLLPDSFSPRGHAGGVCTVPPQQRNAGVTPIERANDAYAALAYLQTLPYVDRNRIGVMGNSHGGASTLATMVAPQARDKGFIAAVALYPACSLNAGAWRADLSGVYANVMPVYILIGDLDDWTPAEHCRRLAETAQKAGHPVTLKVYPGAHHAFDNAGPVRFVASRVNQNAPGRRGATTGGDPAAWADSIREIPGFFGRHLGR